MNIIRIMGGVGNQFFQYAFGRVQRENGIDVAYDLSWCETRNSKHPVYPRPYRLDMFSTHVPIRGIIQQQPLIKEHTVGFNPALLHKQNCNFEGYWQYLDYYRDIMPTLQKEFTLRDGVKTKAYNVLAAELIGAVNTSVHVRRGDYLTHKGKFKDLQLRYYIDALAQTEGHIYIFSDDLDWCRGRFDQNYYERAITFIDLDDYLCIALMSLCKYNVVTNSTFSWWAAMLNTRVDKHVICPMHWLGERDGQALHYPDNWVKIEDYVRY